MLVIDVWKAQNFSLCFQLSSIVLVLNEVNIIHLIMLNVSSLVKLLLEHNILLYHADSVRATHGHRARDDSSKKGNASTNSDSIKRSNMEGLAQGEHFDGKDSAVQDKGSGESRDGKNAGSSTYFNRKTIFCASLVGFFVHNLTSLLIFEVPGLVHQAIVAVWLSPQIEV